MIVDTGDELITINTDEVVGKSVNTDGSQDFKLVGGPYNGHTIRAYTPYPRVVFTVRGNTETYKLNPPVKHGGKWVYVHDILDVAEYTPEESNWDRLKKRALDYGGDRWNQLAGRR